VRPPLRRLRLRLTAWYLGAFVLVLLVTRVLLFGLLTRETSRELDRSLRDVTRDIARATSIRLEAGLDARRAAIESADELSTSVRPVYLYDPDGAPIFVAGPEPEGLRDLAGTALREGSADETLTLAGGRRWRALAQRIPLAGAGDDVVIVLADLAEVNRDYATLSRSFLLTALATLLLVAVGGWYLASVSVAPVERMMDQMRRFMADAAHELRTPVTVLRSRAELTLEREREPAAYAAALEEIAREAARMAGVVDGLFTLARADADAGAPAPEQRPLFLDDLVSDALAAASALAEAKGVGLELGRYEEAPARGDPALIRQLLMILLDNAIKYTPLGGCVEVEVFQDGAAAVVVVEDNGMGFDPAEIPRLFERFYRSDRAREQTGGAGLGLSIARWIADSHGARLHLAPRTGGGARAELRFPPAL
jgi:signal transduction histidine kinase